MRRSVLLPGLVLVLIQAASGKDVAAEPVNSIEAALRQHTELVVDRPQAHGIRHFLRMFQATAQRFTDDDLARLRQALETNR